VAITVAPASLASCRVAWPDAARRAGISTESFGRRLEPAHHDAVRGGARPHGGGALSSRDRPHLDPVSFRRATNFVPNMLPTLATACSGVTAETCSRWSWPMSAVAAQHVSGSAIRARPESYWIKVRNDLDLDQGAAADVAVRHRAPHRGEPAQSAPNDSVLITGASGRQGTATLQLPSSRRHRNRHHAPWRQGCEAPERGRGSRGRHQPRRCTGDQSASSPAVKASMPGRVYRRARSDALCIDALRSAARSAPWVGSCARFAAGSRHGEQELNVHGIRAPPAMISAWLLSCWKPAA